MSIDWVPLLNVPMHRRYELFAAAFQMYFLLFGQFLGITLFLFCLISGGLFLRTLSIAYVLFMYWDREAGELGGRGAGANWVRNWLICKYFVDYFPVDLKKTVDLPPNRNYLFAVFPHGVIGSGSFANFCTNYSKWRTLFPGIRSKLITLGSHMYAPLFREVALSLGMATSSAKCLGRLLTQSNDPKDPANADGFTSNGVCLLVGGAEEALYAHRNSYKIVLNRRKGFVRLALQAGAPIVPVFSFGETGVFDQASNPPGSFIRKCQELIKKYTGIAPILFNGRGFLQYNFGIIPKRCPITQVVGAPIEVTQTENPTDEEVERIHSEFTKALIELFEANKVKYLENGENVQLEIV